MGMLSELRRIAPAAICIVCGPCVATGDVLKWKVIVALRFDNTNEFAGVPFTVKSVASTLDTSAGSLRLTIESTGCVLMTLLQAGTVVVTAKPTSSLSVKASCWDAPLIGLRPSTQEVTCLVSIEEP